MMAAFLPSRFLRDADWAKRDCVREILASVFFRVFTCRKYQKSPTVKINKSVPVVNQKIWLRFWKALYTLEMINMIQTGYCQI